MAANDCSDILKALADRTRQRIVKSLLTLALSLAATGSGLTGTLKINGSTTVNLPVAEAAEILRAEKKMDIQVDTQGGSSGGISMLAEGQVQIGMSSKPVSDDDRKKYPQCDFREIHIGEDAVALIVARDVWDGGVRTLTKAQAKDIYESKPTGFTAARRRPRR